MHRALEKLKVPYDSILVDGNRFKPFKEIPYSTVVKGDATYMSIAAASILAKTYRDDKMMCLDREYPVYNWKRNKGYPTREHREAIRRCGTTKYHRMTFRLLDNQLSLDFTKAEDFEKE